MIIKPEFNMRRRRRGRKKQQQIGLGYCLNFTKMYKNKMRAYKNISYDTQKNGRKAERNEEEKTLHISQSVVKNSCLFCAEIVL